MRWSRAFGALAVAGALWTLRDPGPRRVLNVVAHPDDDLLFLSPDLFADVGAGSPTLTVYLTAGDAGRDRAYWTGRERGAMAAHARIAGLPDAWTASDHGAEGRIGRMVSLDADPDVRLLFLRLPDGFDGCGSCAQGQQSLRKLWQGDLDELRAVDGSAAWGRASLVAALADLMEAHRPGLIRVQDPEAGFGSGDHSDHLAAARFAIEATARYGRPAEIHAYAGYPAVDRPVNLPGADVHRKRDVFFTYAAHDPAACDDIAECEAACGRGRTCYPRFFARQHRVSIGGSPPLEPQPLTCRPCESYGR